MTSVRPATETISFIDEYAAHYRDLFSDVRSFDHFTRLHVGLLSDVARKSLPAIARISGAEPQALHHFIANADWDVTDLRQRRLKLTREALRGQSFILCIDETGARSMALSPIMSLASTLATSGLLRQASSRSTHMACLARSPFLCCFRSSSPSVASRLATPI